MDCSCFVRLKQFNQVKSTFDLLLLPTIAAAADAAAAAAADDAGQMCQHFRCQLEAIGSMILVSIRIRRV